MGMDRSRSDRRRGEGLAGTSSTRPAQSSVGEGCLKGKKGGIREGSAKGVGGGGGRIFDLDDGRPLRNLRGEAGGS